MATQGAWKGDGAVAVAVGGWTSSPSGVSPRVTTCTAEGNSDLLPPPPPPALSPLLISSHLSPALIQSLNEGGVGCLTAAGEWFKRSISGTRLQHAHSGQRQSIACLPLPSESLQRLSPVQHRMLCSGSLQRLSPAAAQTASFPSVHSRCRQRSSK